ncbi:ShlB/FhaC/HecB family hemolysin secretion/activation protein [Serratia ureilytica]|uniref:ShlB/FhaC/HecB family hemolysin secretion/activation protein n=1 Tax=Serratia ureilytica TaxID=300181 RepID=UPI001C105483|nr:ShlB/FhaC/HecB family hemolysin secretion/activation protein [Serratia ureilytica]MBU5412577.1 ShlB/FhaC/HecB family hemolysin secretion/activation protein [Serratia ureilytica]
MKRNFPLTLLVMLYCFGSQAKPALPSIKQVIGQENIISETQRQLLPTAPTTLVAALERETMSDGIANESPCVLIAGVELVATPAMPAGFNTLAQSVQGRCMGKNGLMRLQKQLQNKAILLGYVTSRVHLLLDGQAPGMITVNVQYGRVGQLRLKAGSSEYFHPGFTFPIVSGEVFNLRRVEQGVENIGLIPDVDSEVRIVPGSLPGESDIEVFRRQDKYWRVTAWADDAGASSTGRYQTGGALYLDNPSSLNDVLYLSLAGSVLAPHDRGNESRAWFYSLPFGFWNFSALGGESRYHQTIAGSAVSYRYHGRSKYWGLQASYTLARGMSDKTSLNAQWLQRDYRYYLNDTEIALQRTRLTSLKLGANHWRYGSRARLAFSADAIANIREESETLEPMLKLGASVLNPFNLSDHRLIYFAEVSGQLGKAQKPIQDKLFIGDRSTVRGVRGDDKLLGSNGGYWRNTLLWQSKPLQPYVGVDYGQLARQQGEGGRLMGSVIGLRLNEGRIDADIFAGAPVIKPGYLPADRLVLGFSSQLSF